MSRTANNAYESNNNSLLVLLEQSERALRQLNAEANIVRQKSASWFRHSPATVITLGPNVRNHEGNSGRSKKQRINPNFNRNRNDRNNRNRNDRNQVSLEVRWRVDSWPQRKNKLQNVMRQARGEALKAFHKEKNDEKAYKEYSRILNNAYKGYYRSQYALMPKGV